jgi:hypothetical protein
MKTLLIGWLTWQGFFVGSEYTSRVGDPFSIPQTSVSATVSVGVGPLSVRTVFIQPMTNSKPLWQVGGSVRLF